MFILLIFRFKVKVGATLEDDIRRCGDVREVIGYENKMVQKNYCIVFSKCVCMYIDLHMYK